MILLDQKGFHATIMNHSNEPDRNPMELSLIKAAEAVGKSKSTISRAIKSGKLSARRNDDGSYSIDASELSRVFHTTGKQHSIGAPSNPDSNSNETLEMKVSMLEGQLGREQDTIEDLRKRLDRAEDRVYALTHTRSKEPQAKGFWARVFRG